jgi:HEAT repeat protein
MRTHREGSGPRVTLRLVAPAALAALLPASTLPVPPVIRGVVFAAPQAADSGVAFEAVVANLLDSDGEVRLRAARMLKDTAYEEAAVPLAPLIGDGLDEVQFEAIAAELNIFLAEPIVSRRRVGLVVEQRTSISAFEIFEMGPLAMGPREVPVAVMDALRKAARDDNPRVRLEAMYAFGALAVEAGGSRRARLLAESGPDLAAMIGAADPFHRYGAVRVLGRVFERRRQDAPVDTAVGDAVIGVLNDSDERMQRAATAALGAMRYDRAVAGLMDLFKYFGRGEPAEATLDAVARIAHPASASLLASQLTSSNDVLKRTAVEGLARTGDRATLAAIQDAVGLDRDESLQLARHFASVMLSDATLDPLVEALARSRTRDRAQSYLIEAAPGRTERFGRHLQDPDPAMRARLASILGLADDPAALVLLQPMGADRDPQVSRAVAQAMARLRQIAP